MDMCVHVMIVFVVAHPIFISFMCDLNTIATTMYAFTRKQIVVKRALKYSKVFFFFFFFTMHIWDVRHCHTHAYGAVKRLFDLIWSDFYFDCFSFFLFLFHFNYKVFDIPSGNRGEKIVVFSCLSSLWYYLFLCGERTYELELETELQVLSFVVSSSILATR